MKTSLFYILLSIAGSPTPEAYDRRLKGDSSSSGKAGKSKNSPQCETITLDTVFSGNNCAVNPFADASQFLRNTIGTTNYVAAYAPRVINEGNYSAAIGVRFGSFQTYKVLAPNVEPAADDSVGDQFYT